MIMSRYLPISQLLLACAALCLAAAAAEAPPPCPPRYPAAELLNACPPVPAWCRRLRGHGAGSWPRCRRRCTAALRFGGRRYPVAWSSAKGAKVPVFGLRLPGGWRRRSLTVWRGKVYARRSRRGRGRGAWQIVYPVDGRLVPVDIGAKPPYDCGKHSPGGGKSGGKSGGRANRWRRRLRGLRVSCHGNACSVGLSLRRLLREAARMRHRRRRGGGHRAAAKLRFVLAAGAGGGARFVSGELLLVPRGRHRRGRRGRRQRHREEVEEEENPAEAYRRFLTGRRQNYWRKKGWRGGGGGRRGGKRGGKFRRRKGGRNRKAPKKRHQPHKSGHRNQHQREAQEKGTGAESSDDKEVERELTGFLKE